MKYKQVFLITILGITGAALFFFILGMIAFNYTVLGGIVFILLGMTFFAILGTPNWGMLTRIKQMAMARFGSTDENDIKSHLADTFFQKIFSARIIAELDPADEDGMVDFANTLKNMYVRETMPEVRKYYPEISDQQMDGLFNTVAALDKDIMSYVFFPEKYGITNSAQAGAKIKSQFPFIEDNTLFNWVALWQNFRRGLERRM